MDYCTPAADEFCRLHPEFDSELVFYTLLEQTELNDPPDPPDWYPELEGIYLRCKEAIDAARVP